VTDPWGIGTVSEFKDIPYLNLTQDRIWNVSQVREMGRPLTPVEDRRSGN
jgi:hypothetical protein